MAKNLPSVTNHLLEQEHHTGVVCGETGCLKLLQQMLELLEHSRHLGIAMRGRDEASFPGKIEGSENKVSRIYMGSCEQESHFPLLFTIRHTLRILRYVS